MQNSINLKLAGENTPIQSSEDGSGELYSSVTHSVFSPCNILNKK